MRKRRLEEEYKDFAKTVISPEAGPNQRKGIRHAFFVGSFAMLRILKDVENPDVDPDELLADLQEEMEAFVSDLESREKTRPDTSAVNPREFYDDRRTSRPLPGYDKPRRRTERS